MSYYEHLYDQHPREQFDEDGDDVREPPWDDRDDLDEREASGVYDQDAEPDEGLSY